MTTLGKYVLHEQLGTGGFGAVYRATDTSLEREVALKVLKPEYAAESEFVGRFQREARVMAQFQHENIVPIYEVGQAGGRFFIAMPYLSGGSLARRIAGGPLPVGQALSVLRDVCAGLEEAHRRGLVHRDLKPANILFDSRGRAYLSDFGLARAVSLSTTNPSTSTGIAGTPYYRAPELWSGNPPASPATDVYALGCILYEMLTGQILFQGDTPEVVITRHLVKGPYFRPGWPPPDAEGLEGVVRQALSKEPGARPRDAEAFFRAAEATAWIQMTPRPDPFKPGSARKRPSAGLSVGIAAISVLLGVSALTFIIWAIIALSGRLDGGIRGQIQTQTALAALPTATTALPTFTPPPPVTPVPSRAPTFTLTPSLYPSFTPSQAPVFTSTPPGSAAAQAFVCKPLLLSEGFDGPAGEYKYLDGANAVLQNGRLRFLIEKARSGRALALYGQYEQFTIEFSAFPVGEVFDASINVLFMQHSGGGYEYQVRLRNHQFQLLRVTKQTGQANLTTGQGWTTNPAVDFGTESTLVRVDVQTGTTTLWINDQKVNTFTDANPFLRGAIYLGAGAGEVAPVTIELDNVRICGR